MTTNIVPTNINYTYDLLSKNLRTLSSTFSFFNFEVAGNSVLGKNIYVIRLGNGPKEVFYSAAIHANEWITSVLLMKFIENYCNSYFQNSTLYGYSIKNIFNSTSIYIMPMVNPDGVDLVTGSLPNYSSAYLDSKNISDDFPNIPFPYGWKSNIKGVDFKIYQLVC